MRERYVYVPINEKGIREYDEGIESSCNLEKYVLSEDEFNSIAKQGVFAEINNKCGLMIDDYETEIIYHKYLDDVSEIMHKVNNTGAFSDALEAAKKYGTMLALDF